MRRFVLPVSFALLLFFVCSLPAARAQHPVLFETVTNSCQPSGSAAESQRNAFNGNVTSVVSSEASKIIHLDLHVGNECDALQSASPAAAATHILPPGNTIFWGAVDRAIFTSTGTRASADPGDWSGAIDAEYSQPPAATLQLIDATLDKTSTSLYRLHVDVKVTVASSIPDSLIIRYAIVQDSCVDNQNGGTNNVILNDVVRQITNANDTPYLVFANGGSAGTQKTMSWDVSLHGPKNFNDQVHYNYPRIRLVAFLEESSGGDFDVVNASVLRQDLDTLQTPPPTLALTSSALDGMTFHPKDILPVPYTSSYLTKGVNAYYSLDNGATWRLFSDSTLANPINWEIPDSATTQGKIRLVAVGDTTLSSTESGTFTIGRASSMTFIHPVNQVLRGDSSYLIQWTKYGVDSVTLKYYLQNSSGGFSQAIPIAEHVTDTFYQWTTPDTTSIVELQLLDEANEAPATSVFDTIEKLVINEAVSVETPASGLQIQGIFPNPAASGEEITVRYTDNLSRPVSIEVLDLLGKVVGQFSAGNNQEINVDTRSLVAGAYIVRVTDGVNVVSKQVEIMR